jgi:hypothetical protein
MNLPENMTLEALPAVAPIVPQSVLLDRFKIHRQEGNLWCWAAVTVSVHEFYLGQPAAQCAVATLAFKNGNVAAGTCCPQITQPQCDKAFSTEIALHVTGHLGQFLARPLEFQEIIGQIPVDPPQAPAPRGHPIGCSTSGKQDVGAHAVAISGWEIRPGSGNFVYVNDPIGPSASFESYDEFKSGKERQWDLTYLTI